MVNPPNRNQMLMHAQPLNISRRSRKSDGAIGAGARCFGGLPLDRHRPDPIRAQQHNPSPPHMLLRTVPRSDHSLQPLPVARAKPDFDTFSHPTRLAYLRANWNHSSAPIHSRAAPLALNGDELGESLGRCSHSRSRGNVLAWAVCGFRFGPRWRFCPAGRSRFAVVARCFRKAQNLRGMSGAGSLGLLFAFLHIRVAACGGFPPSLFRVPDRSCA
jgi:hypothetical protein